MTINYIKWVAFYPWPLDFANPRFPCGRPYKFFAWRGSKRRSVLSKRWCLDMEARVSLGGYPISGVPTLKYGNNTFRGFNQSEALLGGEVGSDIGSRINPHVSSALRYSYKGSSMVEWRRSSLSGKGERGGEDVYTQEPHTKRNAIQPMHRPSIYGSWSWFLLPGIIRNPCHGCRNPV